MLRSKTRLERQLEAFIQVMEWSPQATEDQKTLVLGNLQGFVAFVQSPGGDRIK